MTSLIPGIMMPQPKRPATASRPVPALPNTTPTGTTTEYEEGIDIDQTKVNGGAPGAALTDGGIASIDPQETGPRSK